MCASPSYSYDDFTHDANRLFNHWKAIREKNISAADILPLFRKLFIDGNDYPEQEILDALHRIATSRWADATSVEGSTFNSRLNFNGIINRCLYILINYWWLHPSRIDASTKLVHLTSYDSYHSATTPATEQLRELVRKFRQTEDYEALQDRVQLAVAGNNPVGAEAEVETRTELPLRRTIYRYPFLYPYSFNRFDRSESGFEAIEFQQQHQQQLFEEELKAYLNYLMVSKKQSDKKPYPFTGKNPTNLTDEELRQVVKQFIGAAEGSHSYKKIAYKKLIQIQQTASCQEMKQQVHSYITSTFQFSKHPQALKYSQSSHFGSWLEERLDHVLQQDRYEKPTGHRLVQTCGEIINCLLASPTDRLYGRFHTRFVSLHASFGATFTTSLFLKITLLFQDMKDYAEYLCRLLAKRFADLLNHYGTAKRDDENVRWLVECLENWQIASSLHFGITDFSHLPKWVRQL